MGIREGIAAADKEHGEQCRRILWPPNPSGYRVSLGRVSAVQKTGPLTINGTTAISSLGGLVL